MRDKFSPFLTLALFSRYLAQPQPDWPAKTVQPGFVFFDRDSVSPSEKLAVFRLADEAPLVFTLGSTAVHNAGNFYEVSAAAAKRLGRRAILIGTSGVHPASSERVLALPYAPYAEIFPRAAVIVHQGGAGTTGQALRAGRPMLIVPYGWDQPDNGARVERAGAGLCLARLAYTPESATAALKRLIEVPAFAASAIQIAKKLGEEDGLTAACDAIESLA